MKVLSYILDFLFEIRRASDECSMRHGHEPCPVQEKLKSFDVYAQMMVLSKRALVIKRYALVIIALALLLTVAMLHYIPLIASYDSFLASKCFYILIGITFLIVAECGLVIAMLSTSNFKPKKKEGASGKSGE